MMELITPRAKEPIKALQKPQRNLNPVTKAAAKPKITALIIRAIDTLPSLNFLFA